MRRHDFLRELHRRLAPRTYLEIGTSSGSGLSLSRARSIGVDPAFTIKEELHCDLQLVRETSDDFFARPDALAHFDGLPADLVFVDGMHLAEYALRDFVNAERACGPASVVVLDDMLPRHVDEAARQRSFGRARGAWAGDVFKVPPLLRRLRPDLVVVEVDTRPTGVVVVLCPDPSDATLGRAYDDVVDGLITRDPQDVPDRVLTRHSALDPEALLASGVWQELVGLREQPAVPGSARVDDVAAVVRSYGLGD